MKYLNIISAVIWGLHFIRFLMGDYHPDSFMIGFSMFFSMMFFVLLFHQMNLTHKEKEGIHGKANQN